MQKAAQDRKQQKESIQEKKQIRKEKNRKRVEDKKNKPSESPLQAEHAGPEQEDQLDLLPDDILQAVAAEDGDTNTYSSEEDEEQNDRRIAERRIVTEQLRQGLKKSKRKAFLEQVTAGPVTVKVLHSQSGAMAYNQTADPKMTGTIYLFSICMQMFSTTTRWHSFFLGTNEISFCSLVCSPGHLLPPSESLR